MYASVSANYLEALVGSYRTYQYLPVILNAYSAYSALNAFECLKCFFAAQRKKILESRATIACYTVSIRSMFSSVLDAMTNTSRVVKDLEVDRMESSTLRIRALA
jgi:hypothetical protein